ncbi:MAG: alpha-ketoglutarate-dependent dioxygenase AlkB [Chitinophagaceae bacterium]|nr:MAG: alpha-ketoglutarate-dependent dioxygenase AlkB [Chitinophagaceae bacterium]
MLSLFPPENIYPPGFRYEPEFITKEEERELVAIIQTISLHPMQFQGYEAKRKVASFGYDWSFEKRMLSKGKEIPPTFYWLIEKLAQKIGVKEENIAELLVTEYPPGSVINWHRDAPPFALIAGISLHSDCTFKLRPHEKEKQTRKATISFTVERRSLYVMEREARIEWQHSIAPVNHVRYSITVRTLK